MSNRERPKVTFKKAIGVLTNAFFAVFMCLLLVITVNTIIQKSQGNAIPMTFGWGNAFVLTGSMEPAIPTRSIITIHETPEVAPGDIVTYIHKDLSYPVTHRVKEIAGNTIITKGDANNIEDPPIPSSAIIGKVVFILTPQKMLLGLAGLITLLIAGTAGCHLAKRKQAAKSGQTPPEESASTPESGSEAPIEN